MRKSVLAAVGMACGLALAPSFAQNLQMAEPPPAQAQSAVPARGMSMAQVEARFGAPTTKQNVQSLFGAPNSVTRGSVQVASQGNPSQTVTVVETWGYQHTEARVDGRSWIPFAGAWLGGTNYETEQVMFGFDGKDVVQQVSSSSQAGRVNAWGVQSQ